MDDFFLTYEWPLNALHHHDSSSAKEENDDSLLSWWTRHCTLNIDEKTPSAECLEHIYNLKYNIALDPTNFFHIYLIHHHMDNSQALEDKLAIHQYPEQITARELKIKFPEIYKIGYLDKIKINNISIVKLKLIILNNTLKLQNDDGFTLNDIAFLSKKYFALNFHFAEYYKNNAEIVMNFDMKKDILKVHIGSDI
jgi:hypothetical protein